MNNNVPGFLVNIFVTEEEAREVRRAMEENQQLMASLDAEIERAKAALKNLVNQRSEAQRLLESNTAPSDTEVRAIREIIRTKEQEMDRLETEVVRTRNNLDAMIERRAAIAEESGPSSGVLDEFDADIEGARSVLKGLLTEREQTHDALEAHRALLSPIRRIPPEVLGEIFIHCLARQSMEPFVQASGDQFPLLLTQISSNWRNVALATPALWTSLAINITTASCIPNLDLIKTWIARSGSCPLSFYIEETIQKDYYTEGIITSASILELYAPHYHRWRNIRLQYQDWRIATGFLHLPRDLPPQSLQSLHLARDFWHASEYDQLSLMLSAPHLRKCIWVSNTDIGTFQAPFPQLTTLFLERPVDVKDFMHILSEGAKLELTQFLVLDSDPSLASDSPLMIRHENLRALDLTADLFGPLFNQLELPCLTHISMTRFDMGAHWPHDEFMSLLLRSKCVLREITLNDIDISPNQMCVVIRHASHSLEKLSLNNNRRSRHVIANDEVLRLLTWTTPDAGSNVCPRLSMIKLWDCHSAFDGALADMIESRWKAREGGPPKLMSIAFLMLDARTYPNDLQRLEALNRKRLGISIVRRPE
ncbi:hypothetical protein R3P38DRAFT_790814 [Favolaschia claudopus]|uniref:F-box domain-containing protein n=1 Tax=Favolaschia claudopus TaxID=2862362 RepID=A0AAW0C1L8_9AGAR